MSAKNLKQRIRNGEHVFGVSVSMMAPRESLAERVEEGGYDFVAVDSQHSAFSEEATCRFLQYGRCVGYSCQLSN